MKAYVLDAGAMIAYLGHEAGCTVVEGMLADPDAACYAHAANLMEAFYGYRRSDGEDQAQRYLSALYAAGAVAREDMDSQFWQDAGRIKADLRRVSVSDCFGLALARRLKCPFVTTDHHELDKDEIRALCEIQFIR